MDKSNPDSVDVLLFDLGGVVIDIDFNRVFSRWAEFSNCGFERIKSKFSFDLQYERHERGEIGAPEYFDSLRRSLGIDISDKQFEDGWNSIYVGEISGMADLLNKAKRQIPIYGFTNSNALHQKVWSKRFKDILKLFETVFVSSEMGLRKPEPESFHFIADSLGIERHRILFFDDSIENIEGARKVGLKALCVESISDVQTGVEKLLA
ncbi:MAG: HAD family phosphatase [Proteobacteria bacterium]|nr:HAD family phosphatase [Pseudomonadota bacterium]